MNRLIFLRPRVPRQNCRGEREGREAGEAREIAGNKNYSADERDTLLDALQTAALDDVRAAFGDAATATYLHHGGEWIDGLIDAEPPK